MMPHFLKTSIRSLLRERTYALIKLVGLALGMGTSMVLMLYVWHELQFDDYHPDVSRTYRINQTNIWSPDGGMLGSTGPALAVALRADYPEVESVLRINTPGSATFRYERPDGQIIALEEKKVLAADTTFFDFIGFTLQEGDVSHALQGKNKVVLSDEAAKRFFGTQPALGKTLMWGDARVPLEVSGVMAPQPLHTHFHVDYLLSMETNPDVRNFEWSWIWTQVVTYVKLKEGADVLAFNQKLLGLADRKIPASFKILGMDYQEFLQGKGGWVFTAQPMRDLHLHGMGIGNRLGPDGDIRYIYIFSSIAIFILAIAMVNFINLSTARASKRAKEVGVRKTLGQSRGTLMAQFQFEHLLLTAIATLLGLGIMELLRLLIQPLTGIVIPLDTLSRSGFVLLSISLAVVVGMVSGLYPAFYLTAFRPAQVLKGKVALGVRSAGLRNVLVIFQFTVSIALMVATVVVYQQLEFFRHQNLGFDREHLMIVEHADRLGNQLQAFRDEVARYPGVKDATISMDLRNSYEDIFMREGDGAKFPVTQFKIDEHFFSTTGLKLAAGRSFDEQHVSDVRSVIINETCAQLFGWTPETALGKKIVYLGDDVGAQEVIGVVRDFHFQSLRQQIAPLIFYHEQSTMWGRTRVMFIRYDPKQLSALQEQLATRWKTLVEGLPFSYTFLDDQIRMQYEAEERLASLFSLFTTLSIVIAVIGLVGLVSYSAEQRRKEIGIRKVFGASSSRIYLLINHQYIRLIAVALLLAAPLSWWLMQQWLNTFSYRIALNPLWFVLAGVVQVIIAMACVGWLALRAASLNPALVLKEE